MGNVVGVGFNRDIHPFFPFLLLFFTQVDNVNLMVI